MVLSSASADDAGDKAAVITVSAEPATPNPTSSTTPAPAAPATSDGTRIFAMGIKLGLTQYQLPIDPDEVECFDEFHEKYGKYITAAQAS
mgnify:CR=1 FL=1